MTNLGIVIAVSEYSGGTPNLPACTRDGQAIAKLLETESRFGDVLAIDKDTKSSSVKSKIIEFINKHKDEEIGDVVFYFTGHGDFSGDEFYYLLSDYDQKRPKQTCIENTELDNLIRNLKPNLFVKIVDACHSGVAYIKNADDFRDYLKSTGTGQFKKLYFMFSSQSEQFSYQDVHLSHFTRKIVEAVATHDASSLRYKDVIDFVSDAFKDDVSQTPFFVTQADFTEVFCDTSVTLKAGLSAFLTLPTLVISSQDSKASTIAELVKKDAELYCTEEEALKSLNLIPKLLSNVEIPKDLQPLYGLRVDVQSSEAPPNSGSIGRWLEQNKDDKRYFISITKESRPLTRRVPRNLVTFTSFLEPQGNEDFKIISEYRDVVTGYTSTVDLPYRYVSLFAEPKYPNLSESRCFVTPIISMTHLRLFWAYAFYESVGWTARRRIGNLEWATDEVVLKDSSKINDVVQSIGSKFVSFIMDSIDAKWRPQKNIQSSTTEDGSPPPPQGSSANG